MLDIEQPVVGGADGGGGRGGCLVAKPVLTRLIATA